MSSDWNCLWRRKRGNKKAEKNVRHPEYVLRGVDPKSSSSGYRDREMIQAEEAYVRGQQEYLFTEEQTDFSYTPEVLRYVGADEIRGFVRGQDVLINRQIGSKTRPVSSYFYENQNASRAVYQSEPFLNKGFHSHYDQNRNNGYLVERERGHYDNVTRNDQINRRLHPFINSGSRYDYDMEMISPYEKQIQHMVSPERSSYGRSWEFERGHNIPLQNRREHNYVQPRMLENGGFSRSAHNFENAYQFQGPALRNDRQNAYARQDIRGRTVQEHARTGVISKYVPTAVRQQDVSALLFGENKEDSTVSTQNYPVSELSWKSRQLEQRYEPSALFKNVTKEDGQMHVIQDARTIFQRSPLQGSRDIGSQISSGYNSKSEHESSNFSSSARSQNWNNFKNSPESSESKTIGSELLVPRSNLAVVKSHRSKEHTTSTARTNNISSNHIWPAERQLNKEYVFRTISNHTNSVDGNSNNDDDVSDEEVANAILQLDMVTRDNSERNKIKALEGVFSSEGEVLY